MGLQGPICLQAPCSCLFPGPGPPWGPTQEREPTSLSLGSQVLEGVLQRGARGAVSGGTTGSKVGSAQREHTPLLCCPRCSPVTSPTKAACSSNERNTDGLREEQTQWLPATAGLWQRVRQKSSREKRVNGDLSLRRDGVCGTGSDPSPASTASRGLTGGSVVCFQRPAAQ